MAERETCGDCDGVGWVEGGKFLKTTCKACDGKGVVAAACPTCQEARAGLYSNRAHTCGEAADQVPEVGPCPECGAVVPTELDGFACAGCAGATVHHTCGKAPSADAVAELTDAVDAGALELRRVAQVVVWDATGACPLRCRDCLKVHGPGPVVMVFDQAGGQVHEFTGNWIQLRGGIMSAVFQHKGQHSVELHLGVEYEAGAAMIEMPATERKMVALPQRGIDEVGP